MDFKAPDDWVAMVDDDAPRNPAWLSRYELHDVPLGSDSATALQARLRESLPHARLVCGRTCHVDVGGQHHHD